MTEETQLPPREPAKSRAPRPRRRRSTYVPGRIPKRQKSKFEQRMDEVLKAVAMVLPPDPRQQKDDSDDPTRGRNLDLSFSIGTAKEHFGFWVGVHSVRMIRGMTGAPAEVLVVFSLNDFGVVGPWRPDYEYNGPRRFLSEAKDALELAKECLVENKGVEEDEILIRCNASFAEPTASQLFKIMQDPAFNFVKEASTTTKCLTPEEPKWPERPKPELPKEAPRPVGKPVKSEDKAKEEPTALANSGLVEKDPPPLRRRHRHVVSVAAAPVEDKVPVVEKAPEAKVAKVVRTAPSSEAPSRSRRVFARPSQPKPEPPKEQTGQTLPAPVRSTFVRSRHAVHPNGAEAPKPSEDAPLRRRSRLSSLLGGVQ